MTPRTLRTFRVSVHEWHVYDVLIKALDEIEAFEKAHELYDNEGHDAFELRDGCDSQFTIEEVRS